MASTRDLLFAVSGAAAASTICFVWLGRPGSKNDGDCSNGDSDGLASAAKHAWEASDQFPVIEKRTKESETVLVRVERLEGFCTEVFVRCGCLRQDATLAARLLVMADHRGIDSHGVARLHAYFTLLQAGEINPRPQVRKVVSTDTTATVDGDNGLGLIV